ncbi:hypothetical protein [Flavobacterium sp. 1355]|uniref:hypothetical protein n=1 Tax=Flavobacterium sp. 1355 TaxID=2806571 RepID=UPI001AE9D846|nr:hypothetical protein [Flavobacterium sp. 1355]MBP1225055.1 hypothetical protein [Flavobacterium sp. 1355]
MDNQDKLFDKIKEASQNAEFKDFPAMEKVWSRVEEKLDKKEAKKTIALWKKIAIAASLLLIISVGSQFLRTDKNANIKISDEVVNNEAVKEPVQKSASEKNQIAISEDSGIVSKTEAEEIIKNQINQKSPVAIHEIQSPNTDAIVYEPPTIVYNEMPASAPSTSYGYFVEKDSVTRDKALSYESEKSAKKEPYRIADSEKESLRAKKSAPLVILNGNAMAHSDDVKRDKMMQEELPNLNPENVESLVILDEPLYIIDGIYYSENDLFGKNPTSPYAPLDKQEIKTITILQDLEATSKYGERGKKGVVIITTRTGKPTPKK